MPHTCGCQGPGSNETLVSGVRGFAGPWLFALALLTAAGQANAFGGTFAAPKSSPAPAPPPIDVDTAEQLLARADFEQANQIAEKVVQKRGLSHDQIVRAYRVLGITYAALEKEALAKDAFILLLTFDPDATIDASQGPKILDPFGEARAYWKGLPQKPGIDVSALLHTVDGGVLKVLTRDPTRVVRRVFVGYRWGSIGEFTTTTLAAAEGTVDVAPPPSGRTRLDYYAQALDDRDSIAFEAGTSRVPKTAFAEVGNAGSNANGGGSSFVGSTPFWIIVGSVAAVSTGTALFLALRPPTNATLTTTLQCAGTRCN